MTAHIEIPVKPGDVLAGRYRVERILGAGNMGVVVAAVHIVLEERVALKFILPGPKGQEQEKHARFLREARACARLKSQHVARVSDVGTLENGAPFMAMEYLDGRDLDAVVAERGPLPVVEAVGYVLQACQALAEAHAAGIVHRDIKPANLFLTKGAGGAPCVKVLDFGISKVSTEALKLTSQEAALGSPLYMSPEHVKSSASVDPRSDIWSLGVTLYELLSARTPFDADRIDALCANILHGPPAPLSKHRADLPAGFEAALMRCLEKDPAARYADVAQLAAALEPFGPPPEASRAAQVASTLGVAAGAAPPSSKQEEARSAPVTGAATNPAASTGSGVSGTISSPAALAAPKPKRGGPAAVVAGVVVTGAVIAGIVLVKARGWTFAEHPAAPSAAATAATPVEVGPPAPSAAPAPEPAPDAGVAGAPAAEPLATSKPSAAAPAPRGKVPPPRQEPAVEPPPPPPPPPTNKPPTVKPPPTTYRL